LAACVVLIGVAGSRLARYGDALGSLTGLSRNWIGMILMATVKSLSELVTGLRAVTIAAAPDLAVGDALGSCVFNLAILAVVRVVRRNVRSMPRRAASPPCRLCSASPPRATWRAGPSDT
jgi:cation:H+ antiporter